jgi:hypothetical protein
MSKIKINENREYKYNSDNDSTHESPSRPPETSLPAPRTTLAPWSYRVPVDLLGGSTVGGLLEGPASKESLLSAE